MSTLVLSVPDRILLPLMLPKSAGLIGMELKRSIKDKIHFTPEEIKEYELHDTADGFVRWNKGAAKDHSFLFEDPEVEFLKKAISILDESEAITDDNYDLAKKIQDLKPGKPKSKTLKK